MNKKTINISEVVQSNFATSTEQGEKVFTILRDDLNRDVHVELDFSGTTYMITAFLNAAIGQLYGVFPIDYIKSHLSVKNASDSDLYEIKEVTTTAKEYFSKPAKMDAAIKKHFPNAE
jgi:hypothetical protein